MEKKRRQIAVVTGASSGIGREFARQIAENYESIREIWVIARRKQALCELRGEIEQSSGRESRAEKQGAAGTPRIRILPLDLGLEASFGELEALLQSEKPLIRMLVNSAGLGFSGKVEELKFSQALPMIDINCRALTAVTMLCLPYMPKGSRILQVDSGSAFLPQPGFGIYAASKSYVLSFSYALREELRGREISVTAVCPGPVKTAFFETGGIKLNPVKRRFLAKPEKVVRKALFDAEKGKAVSVCGVSMKLVRAASRIFPREVMTRLSAALLGRG